MSVLRTPASAELRSFLNYKICKTEAEAEKYSRELIGGGVIQKQGENRICFSARELEEKIARGEI